MFAQPGEAQRIIPLESRIARESEAGVKRTLLGFSAFLLLFSPSAVGTISAQTPVIAKTNLKVGETAPDFTLLSDSWTPVKLSDYRGKKNVILAFYVLAFTSG